MYPPLHPLFSSAQEPEDVAAITLSRALEISGRPRGNVQLARWSLTGGLEIVAQRGFKEEFLSCFRLVSIRDGCACGRALLERNVVVVDDVLNDARFATYWGVLDRAGVRSVQSIPLLSTSGAMVGMLSVHDELVRDGPQGDLPSLLELARSAANAIIAIRASRRSAHYSPGNSALLNPSRK
jgi:GAF domain-containing protein